MTAPALPGGGAHRAPAPRVDVARAAAHLTRWAAAGGQNLVTFAMVFSLPALLLAVVTRTPL